MMTETNHHGPRNVFLAVAKDTPPEPQPTNAQYPKCVRAAHDVFIPKGATAAQVEALFSQREP